MILVLARTALTLFLAADGGVAAPDPVDSSVAAAQKALETARGRLSEAIRRLEKDPPVGTDVEAASAAMAALKETLTAGAENEPRSLDYAKAALAAHKELRSQREYVEQRRRAMRGYELRRALESALTSLNDRAKRTEGPKPTTTDFDDARAAAAALQKSVDEAHTFEDPDPQFTAYLAEVEASLAHQQKAIDDRWTILAVEKQRPLLELGRKELATSMAVLTNTASDEQFLNADRMVGVLTQRLEDGKELESKNDAYRTEAEQVRKDLVDAKWRIEELWSAAGLERVKAEVEPIHSDLGAVKHELQGKSPTEDRLAEARTASIVVRMLMEKYQVQASRLPAVRQYLDDVNKTALDVEVELERRLVESAREKVAQAKETIEKVAPSDENFEQVQTAVAELETTLESVHNKEPSLAKTVTAARDLIKNTRATLTKRRLEVDLQRQRVRLMEARRTTAAAVNDIDLPNAGPAQLEEAEKAIAQLGAMLEEGAALTKRDSEYAVFARQVKDRIAQHTARISARKIAVASIEAKGALNDLTVGAKSKVDGANQAIATDADIEAATQAIETVRQAIDSRRALEKLDKGYASRADKARADLEKMREGLAKAKDARQLRNRTGEVLTAGAAVADNATALKEIRAQRQEYEKALAQFKACDRDGSALVRKNPALAKVEMNVEGRTRTAKEVVSVCADRIKATEQVLARLGGLIAFEDGPRKSYEAAKKLLSQSKKNEARDQYDECISSGMVLKNRNPELKHKEFEVAGGKMTLAEVIDQCIKQSEPLQK